MRFKDREHAAHLLVERLSAHYKDLNPLVLGVPRGAVPMAKIIAKALGGELDVVLVHKLEHPDQAELAIGAIDESGNAFLSDWASDVDPEYIEAEKQRQLSVLRERRAQYTPRREPVECARGLFRRGSVLRRFRSGVGSRRDRSAARKRGEIFGGRVKTATGALRRGD